MTRIALGWMLLCAGLLAGPPAGAASAARVEGVQLPAWIERDGQRSALAPGMALRPGDQLSTGLGSRLLLRLAEGSLVKLGENAAMKLAELEPDRGGIFSAALSILEGAFRFTTQKIGAQRRREVRISAFQLTIGLRGTDLWGRSKADRQLVCLIEGKIDVTPEGEAVRSLDQPLQFYVRDKGVSQPLAFITPGQLKQWAAETEIAAGQGAARRGGRWALSFGTAPEQSGALALYDRLQRAGYPARIVPRRAGEAWGYETRIDQLASKSEAEAIGETLEQSMGLAPKVVAR